ncbi:MAG: alpha/beta fold hydrolase [Planctomycetes bacterium]|nr:alpha/beta fold hydrolase [Planctomycetota bacterium]
MTSVEFVPHPLFPSGHLQTLAGVYWPRAGHTDAAQQHTLTLPDGDRVILHDNCPPDWHPGDRTALLIHGLSGSYASPYMIRISRKLAQRGVRAFCLDLRGCGAGLGLARLPYHSGRSEDAAAALRFIHHLCPGSPTALIGFSLGGNITLKLIGETPSALPANLERAIAVCPPVDLLACVQGLTRGVNRLYDRHFVNALNRQILDLRQHIPDAPQLPGRELPKGVFDFDDRFTAPVCGFGTALNYYRLCSSAQFVPEIRLPTVILAAGNDPLVPADVFQTLAYPRTVRLVLTRSGGHMGFIARRTPRDPDRHWMDWRILEWTTSDRPTS